MSTKRIECVFYILIASAAAMSAYRLTVDGDYAIASFFVFFSVFLALTSIGNMIQTEIKARFKTESS